MKTKTNLRGGGLISNHSETLAAGLLAKSAVQSGRKAG